MTDVDAAIFTRLLRKVEALADLLGWDNPPIMYVIYDTCDAMTAELYSRVMSSNPQLGPPTVLAGYAAQPMLDGTWFTGDGLTVGEAVTRFALNTAYGDLDESQRMREILSVAGVLGFAFCGEGWATSRREVAVRSIFEGVHIGSEPDSEETRMIYASDVAGRRYQVNRRRGQPAEVGMQSEYGDFSTAVALLCDVVRGTVPAPEEFETRYPSLRRAVIYPQEGRRP